MTTTQSAVAAVARPRPVAARRIKAVKWWAWVGVFSIGLTVYAWTDWIVSGDAHRVPTGPTPVPTWTRAMVRSWEIAMVVVALAVLYRFVVRPWRLERRLNLDALMIIAFVQTWMLQDPWLNYSNLWFTYNSAFVNLGCPQCHVPGWQAPNSHLFAEPIVFLVGMYVGVFILWARVGTWAMRRAKARWPELGTFGVVMSGYAFVTAIEFPLELLWMRSGAYSYSGSIRWLTPFAGHAYQLPVYQTLLGSALVLSWSCLRYFTDEKGHSFAERGIDRVKATPRQKTGLRFLAVLGILNTFMFLIYSVPTQWFGTHADDFPRDVLQKSYLTNQMCGPGTAYACPGTRVPMVVSRDSAHATPEGTMVAPKGLPVQGE